MAKKKLGVVPKKVITDEEIKKLVDGLRPGVFISREKKCSEELIKIIKKGDMRPVSYLIKMAESPMETVLVNAYAARILGECADHLNEGDGEEAFEAVAAAFMPGLGAIDYCVPYTFPDALVSLSKFSPALGLDQDQIYVLGILEEALGKTHSFVGQSRAPIEKFTRKAKEERKEIIGKAISVLQGEIIKQEQKERKKVKR